MRVKGSHQWFVLCEQLGFTYNCPLPPLTFRPKPSPPPLVDVNMADSPAVSTPLAGQKRSREDDGENGDVVEWDLDMRAEKVGFLATLLVVCYAPSINLCV